MPGWCLEGEHSCCSRAWPWAVQQIRHRLRRALLLFKQEVLHSNPNLASLFAKSFLCNEGLNNFGNINISIRLQKLLVCAEGLLLAKAVTLALFQDIDCYIYLFT